MPMADSHLQLKTPDATFQKHWGKTVFGKKLEIHNTNRPLGEANLSLARRRTGICARHRCSSSFLHFA